MAMYDSSAGELTDEQIGALVVRPVMNGSIAAQLSTVVNIGSESYRVPLWTADPAAAWVAEGAEITPADGTVDELEITPKKVAGLTIISRELAEDSSPSAQQLVGEALSRDIARKVDAAFFGNTTTNGPSGVGSVTLSAATYANGGVADLDWAADALSKSEQQGGNISAFVTDPTTALSIAKLKDQSGSNRTLLDGNGRSVLGKPLLVSSAVTSGAIYAFDSRFSQLVVRAGSRVEVDKSVFFTSDRVAVKATMRVGFAFTHPLALVKITEAAE